MCHYMDTSLPQVVCAMQMYIIIYMDVTVDIIVYKNTLLAWQIHYQSLLIFCFHAQPPMKISLNAVVACVCICSCYALFAIVHNVHE